MNDNEYQTKVDADFDMDVWKDEQRSEYRELLLSGRTIYINGFSYSVDDMVPEQYKPSGERTPEGKQFNHCLTMILKGAGDSDKLLKEFLEPQLDKVIEEMIDEKIKLEMNNENN